MAPPLILLHGALGSARQFDEVKPLLAEDFTVYTFSFSGHGGLPVANPFSIHRFAEELWQFAITHNLAGAAIFGYSMGGYVALQCALHHPGVFDRIMTLGTKMKWDPDIATKEVKMLNPEIIEQKVPAFAESLKARHAPVDWKANILATASMMTRLGNGQALTEKQLEQISHPVLLCLGEHDSMVTAAETIWAADHLPNGQFKLIPGWKHPIETISPAALASEIRTHFITQ